MAVAVPGPLASPFLVLKEIVVVEEVVGTPVPLEVADRFGAQPEWPVPTTCTDL